jgi:hypothetical protein
MMSAERKGYLAYLVRLWQVNQEGGAAWRASLEDAHSGESCGFISLEDLFDFLCQRVKEYSMKENESENSPDTS